jgi:hypothetical protein
MDGDRSRTRDRDQGPDPHAARIRKLRGEVRGILTEREQFQTGAANAVAAATESVDALESRYRGKVKLLSQAQDQGFDVTPFLDEVVQTNQKLKAASAELERAEEFARSRSIAWERLSRVINETLILGET